MPSESAIWLLIVVISLITLQNLAGAKPHIEDELEEIKEQLGEVFTSNIPANYYKRSNLQDCHSRFHRRLVNEHRMAVFNGTSVNGTEFPHMAVLGWRIPSGDIQWKCGGSLITRRFVLTAAHCATDKPGGGGNPADTVRLGDVNLELKTDDHYAQQYGVIRVIKHPDHIPRHRYNDLALVQLERDVIVTAGVCPACVWPTTNYPYDSYEVAGFGVTEFGGNNSPDLLKAQLMPVDSLSCATAYPKDRTTPDGIRDDQICASNPYSDTCQGDSGGPLQTSLYTYERVASFLIGVTSFGKYCGHKSFGVYQQIAPHIRWIESVVQESLNPVDCVTKYNDYLEPTQMEGETEAVNPYFSRVYLHWDDAATDTLCGATLLDYNVAITSAHCTYNIRGESPTKISIIDRLAGITEIERHPNFKRGSFYNDVALIRLNKFVSIAEWIAPVCLPYPSALRGYQTTPETFSCRTPKTGFSQKLQIYLTMKSRCSINNIENDIEYSSRFPQGFGDTMSCYGTDYRLVPGLGEIDLGGPLLSHDETIIFGVNTYATDCGSFNPLVTTNVAPLIPWIERFVLKKDVQHPQAQEPLTYVDRALYVGSACTTKDAKRGKCALTKACGPEVLRYKNREVEPMICGFEQEKAVICCPNEN